MSKIKTKILEDVGYDALLRAEEAAHELTNACYAMLTIVTAAEINTWERIQRQANEAAAFFSYRLPELWVEGATPLDIMEGLGGWTTRALGVIGLARGHLTMREALYGIGSISRGAFAAVDEAYGAVTSLIEVHRSFALEHAAITAVERAETEAQVLRAARRVIRPRARGVEFEVGVAEAPSYVTSAGGYTHFITVTPRWREVVQALGTATPDGAGLILDGRPCDEIEGRWHIVVARTAPSALVHVERLAKFDLASGRRSRQAERAYAASLRASEPPAAAAA